ncbi:LOW QUALITY PROTEIN: blood vessel epicardial substance-like [Palaemon carinicauda]|uniref:LOW QUALITY PROTEIN: blood vessel epicardial substance-like n=1 Tax=Palaemon carinicauda TaxID=392227 RepID=UPI0035B5EEDA
MLLGNSSGNLLGGSAVTKMSASFETAIPSLQHQQQQQQQDTNISNSSGSSGSVVSSSGVSIPTSTPAAEVARTLLANFTLGTLYNDSGGGGAGVLEGRQEYPWPEGFNDSILLLGGTESSNSSGGVGEVFANISVIVDGGNGTGAVAEKRIYCTEWPGATLTLFQAFSQLEIDSIYEVANLFCLMAFVVPHNFRLSALVMRIILCVGILLFTLWAGLDICAPDIFAWNLGFLVVNAGHVLHLTYTFWPPRVPEDLADLYAKVFKPLKVNHQNFCHLVREATLLWLEPGETYAVEDVTPADERLSILISGKLRVTCDSTHLHYILPTQFIDSPEWEACADDSDQVFQVTIVAEERSKYLCWSRPRLRHVLHLRPFLRAVIHNLIGKDITTKLYSLNEQLGVSGLTSEGVRGLGAQDVWRGVVQRSMSVDNVHTGTKGFVRSLAWRASHRRTSTTYCESVRSSPGRSRGSHASDPALKATCVGAWGSNHQHAQGSQQRLLAPPSPQGLMPPLASGIASSPPPPAPPVLNTGSLAGSSSSSSRRTHRENVVRFLGLPNT